jgi:arylsulfatase A-like enzyme
MVLNALLERVDEMGIQMGASFRLCLLAISVLTVAGLTAIAAPPSASRERPNVVFILTDNQGAWTLGCYGNPDIRTPNIDRLAQQGIRFTRALSSNPVCSPTRATFLTGLIPSQHGLHSFLDPQYMMGPRAYNTLDEFTSLGEILQQEGYVCGLSGKWHLGANLQPSEGFTFWITKPDGSTREFYDQDVIENGHVRREAGYTTELWTRNGIEFIERNRDRPFFLYLAYNGPYSLGKLMLNPPRNRHADYYRGHHFQSFPVDTMHPWQHHNKAFHNQQVAMERVAAETSGVDDGVGEILDALQRLGLEENTLVVYAADQGWMGGQNGLWGMGDHTRPIGAHEMMMQIPLIFRQSGRIAPGRTSDHLVSNYDFLPSMLGYLGLSQRLPKEPVLPGRDFSPALLGNELSWDETVFYEMETCRAIRTAKWKYVARFPDGPFELYDMTNDPQERFNLFGQSGTEAKRAELSAQLDAFFAKHAEPKYDVWRGGGSKARRLTGENSK